MRTAVPKENPGWATGAGEVNLQRNHSIQVSRFFLKFPVLCRMIFLTSSIGADFEPKLSLAIDRAPVNLEVAP